MKTFLATTLTETAVSQDKRRFQLTFVDAQGDTYAISIPSGLAADLVPVLESIAALTPRSAGSAEMTRLPKTCSVGHATGERMVLLRFDDEAPYAIELEVAQALAEQLQEQSTELSDTERPLLHWRPLRFIREACSAALEPHRGIDVAIDRQHAHDGEPQKEGAETWRVSRAFFSCAIETRSHIRDFVFGAQDSAAAPILDNLMAMLA